LIYSVSFDLFMQFSPVVSVRHIRGYICLFIIEMYRYQIMQLLLQPRFL
jgi:hypothetical protein